MPRIPGDVIVLPAADGRWVLYNVFAHTALGVGTRSLAALRAAEALDVEQLSRRHPGPFEVWEIGGFPNLEGLLADPSGFVRDVATWPDSLELDGRGLRAAALEAMVLIEDEEAYRARFAPKSTLLDSEHIGDFHQRLGQVLWLEERQDPARWWRAQKFTEGGGAVRANLYGAVQASFLEAYFRTHIASGDRVLDVGCGTGYYANRMAEAGATVLGLDPNEAYIEEARSGAAEGAHFEVRALGEPGAMDHLSDSSYDLVFMIDALLFYFVSPEPGRQPDITELLGSIRRVLTPGGSFISVEPHYTFWLRPWLGDVTRPFTVLTEYNRPVTRVTPSMGAVVGALTANGFCITDMRELIPADWYREQEPRAYHFAREFPLWQLFETRLHR